MVGVIVTVVAETVKGTEELRQPYGTFSQLALRHLEEKRGPAGLRLRCLIDVAIASSSALSNVPTSRVLKLQSRAHCFL